MNVSDAPPGGWRRPPLDFATFDARIRRFEELYPKAYCTRRRSTRAHNIKIGVREGSHLRGDECDYGFDDPMDLAAIALCYLILRTLGLKGEFHDSGHGWHLHVQAP